MKVAELRDKLKEMGLSPKGKKDELLKRLEENTPSPNYLSAFEQYRADQLKMFQEKFPR